MDEAGLDAHELAARKVEDFASSVRGRVLHGDDVAGADRDVEQLCPEGALGQPEEFEDEGGLEVVEPFVDEGLGECVRLV